MAKHGEKKAKKPNKTDGMPSYINYSLFAPTARVAGLGYGFVNRDAELQRVLQTFPATSVLVIQGIAGIGKSAFAAKVCAALSPEYETKWVFCAEKQLTLGALCTNLAYDLYTELDNTHDSDQLAYLKTLLATAFNDEELQDLCFDLRVEYENLPGRSKRAKVMELLLYMQRRGELKGLLHAIKACRPQLAIPRDVEQTFDVHSKNLQKFRRVLQATDDSTILADALIDFLQDTKLLLVFDGIEEHASPDIDRFIHTFKRSRTAAKLLLTSSHRIDGLTSLPLVSTCTLTGLGKDATGEFLRVRDIDIAPATRDQIWHKAGNGNPTAMALFVGISRTTESIEFLDDLPIYSTDLLAWVNHLFDQLSADERAVLNILALVYEPIGLPALAHIWGNPQTIGLMERLINAFLVVKFKNKYSSSSFLREHLLQSMGDAEKEALTAQIMQYYRDQAHKFIIGSGFEPSYGTLYLKAHQDYVEHEALHRAFIDQLLERLHENQIDLPADGTAVVLGAGHGTHDRGIAAHGLRIINVELLDEVIRIGQARAPSIAPHIQYIQADMTQPVAIPAGSADVVFNIGSSFGFEADDAANLGVLKNAARILKAGAPLVFEFANGTFWRSKEIETRFEGVTLGDGSIRTKYAIGDPQSSITLVSLEDADGTQGWFYHYMRYYSLDEVMQMMHEVDLSILAVYGDSAGQAFDPSTSRSMVILAKKGA